MMLIIKQHEIHVYDLRCTGQCIYSLSDLCGCYSKKRQIQKRDEDWGGGVGDKQNSRSYWKAAVSILVNMAVFSPQTDFTCGIQMHSYSMKYCLCTSAVRWWYGRNVKPDLSQMDPFHLLFNAYSLLTSLYFLFPPKVNSHFFFQIGLLNGKELRELRATILKGNIYNVNIHLPLEYLGKDIKHMQIKAY